ncbi:CapA family protein [Brevibacillus sp. SYSU BS000544]|uniref:CapA family protein n=1 Tax=Brevibacillus sp. SYSU BS000544 TaxID=3416443 RepID=UPI003CE5C27D
MKRFFSLVTAVSLLLVTGCSIPAFSNSVDNTTKQEAKEVSSNSAAPSPTSTNQPVSPPPPEPVAVDQRVTLMTVGDIMVHDEQLEAAWDTKSKSYQFQPFFAKVQPILKQGDIVIGNLETTLAGADLRYSGYPEFNSPDSLATTLKQVGFTALTTANNHSLDRREKGVIRTLDALKRADLPSTGTFRTAEERMQPMILEKNGVKLAVLAYSYGTNGIPLPKGKPYLVNLIQPALIKQDIARAKLAGADIVAVALHFGNEYQRMPSDFQKKTANQCLVDGADLIIGHHPHVVQPYEWRTVTLPDGKVKKGLIMYSLGNFISAQRNDYKDIGAIAKITLLKDKNGTALVENAEIIPTYVHYYRQAGKRNYVIYPIAQTLQARGKQNDPQLTLQVYRLLERYHKEMIVHVNKLIQTKKLASK